MPKYSVFDEFYKSLTFKQKVFYKIHGIPIIIKLKIEDLRFFLFGNADA